jgi:hypothetical protein
MILPSFYEQYVKVAIWAHIFLDYVPILWYNTGTVKKVAARESGNSRVPAQVWWHQAQ